MVKHPRYVPSRGHVVWINLSPQQGNEQSGRRPALVVSPEAYNRKTGLALLCPITSHVKGYPFEVILPDGFSVNGAVLADQVRCVDWQFRGVTLGAVAPEQTADEVVAKLAALIGAD